MSIAKIIQHSDHDNNMIINVRLELAPTFTGGTDKLGKFGMSAEGAFGYIAGYSNGVPVINYLRPYLPVSSTEDTTEVYIKIVEGIAGFKNSIALDIQKLISKIIKDTDPENTSSTFSSQRIVSELASIYFEPIRDEDQIEPGLSSEDLNDLYPVARVNDSYYSITKNIQYTKISLSEWKANPILEPVPITDIKADTYSVNDLNPAPTSSTDTGTKGEIRYTEDYIYLCVDTNTWKRSPLETF